jgi:PhnB protein
MQMSAYLSFKGDCEAAFKLYERCLGGQVGPIFRYAGSPAGTDVAADWQDKIMHGSITVGSQLLMGSDPPPDRYEAPKGFGLSLQIDDIAEAERVFGELADQGARSPGPSRRLSGPRASAR